MTRHTEYEIHGLSEFQNDGLDRNADAKADGISAARPTHQDVVVCFLDRVTRWVACDAVGDGASTFGPTEGTFRAFVEWRVAGRTVASVIGWAALCDEFLGDLRALFLAEP